jgi:hypothetical protein
MWRLGIDETKALGQDAAHFVERHGTDRRHRSHVTENPQDVRRHAQDPRRQPLQSREPFAPDHRAGPPVEFGDQRQREVAKMGKMLEVAGDRGRARRIRVIPK